jgi:hypothetical protein
MLQIDRSIALTIANRAWGITAGPITLILIASNLTPAEQGFYFAFSAVLGLQIFFELGLGFVVMQTVSHLMAGQTLGKNKITGDMTKIGLLGRLLTNLLQWYGLVCFTFTIVILGGGYWFFDRNAASVSVNWQVPWLIIVPIFGFSILINAVFSFLEGLGLMADVVQARLIQAICSYLSLWLMLYLGFKLSSLIALHALNLIISSTWILYRHSRILKYILEKRAIDGSINWGEEIWPFQWRIAVSWLAGYCGTQVITLILFSKIGAVEAGRFGLTLTALGAIASGATAWVSTKTPQFGRLVALSKINELDNIYRSAYMRALFVGAFGLILLIICILVLKSLEFVVVERFLSIDAIGILAVATIVTIKVSSEAYYLRAFRREPYMMISIALGLGQVLLAIMLAPHGGVLWVAYGHAILSILIGVLWANTLFSRLRLEYMVNR